MHQQRRFERNPQPFECMDEGEGEEEQELIRAARERADLEEEREDTEIDFI
jgi:hypothetical protein